MSLNAVKTKCMYVCTRQKRQRMKTPFRPLYIQNTKIDEVSAHKILGVTIDRNLTWTEHIAHMAKSISKKVFQLSKIKKIPR